jgi:ribosomal protein S27AE
MHQQEIVTSFDELLAIAASKPKKTRTYQVTDEVAEANYIRMIQMSGDRMRPMTETEMTELGDFLEIDPSEIRSAHPCIEEKKCPKCGRSLTFTDLLNEAVSINQHAKTFMADVLLGRIGSFVTISGSEDDSHRMRCLNCGDNSVSVEHGDCYKTKCNGKTYAHCAW